MIAHLKGMRRSLTIWVNGLILALLPALDYAKDSLPQLADYLSPEHYKAIMLVVVGLNIALRFRTSTSLADKVTKDSPTP
jgi:hypothetical protein